jgi:serine/threonine protein kinase
MPDKRQCPKCEADLAADAPKGLCPRCLMAAGLGDDFAAAARPTIPVKAILEEEIGGRIDRYKILQKLGEGGCGMVYMAEQTDPVRRRVALKVIKLGMDTKQVIGRFEAERQALALMDHPNIAKVLDAGATEKGRPYFVMELVKGIRLTDYCDQNHLSAHERLLLFVQVCQAIQHAHQKGIIHRDIKPSNILVTLHDGTPVPKVIDFGIAKATDQPLTEKTVFTAVGHFMGTPAYMSPEQAELSGLDIDTRSDIYALGVLLYELLTGQTPFDARELAQAGLDEMRRRIREEDPIRPSTRLSTMADADLTEVAHRRKSEPAKLTRFIRGDLDWIVMKCLEKDRTRRYETANGLAMDIRRYLESEPVMARPPSTAYRFRKLVRRNKLAVTAVCGVTAALLLGLSLSTWLWLGEREANHRMRSMMKFFTETQIRRTSLPNAYKNRAPSGTNVIPNLVLPGDSRLNGKTYEQWAAGWLEWALQMPLTNSAGVIHQTLDSDRFEVTASQTSNVWFLGGPFGKVRRSCVIPSGKALFFPLFNVFISSLESPPFYGKTSVDQAASALYFAGHIESPFCELDGRPISNLDDLRVLSPQVAVSVPTPWLQGDVGGKGTATVAGYFVFLSPLPPGEHILRFGGSIRLVYPQDSIDLDASIDLTYQIKVVEPAETGPLSQK